MRGDEAFDLCNGMSGYMPDTTDSGRLSNFMSYYQTANNVLSGNFGGYFWLGAERRLVDTENKWFWVVSGLPNRDLNSVTSSHFKLYLLFFYEKYVCCQIPL